MAGQNQMLHIQEFNSAQHLEPRSRDSCPLRTGPFPFVVPGGNISSSASVAQAKEVQEAGATLQFEPPPRQLLEEVSRASCEAQKQVFACDQEEAEPVGGELQQVEDIRT
eukprot:g13019.t1